MAGGQLFPSRRLRGTPFTKRVETSGVSGYTVYNHMLLPTSFKGLAEDCAHLKQYAQIWDVSAERQVQLEGPDAHRLACMISVRDLRNAQSGRCYYAPITDKNGYLLNDPVALCIAEDKFWFSIADSDLLFWAAGLAQGLGWDVEVTEPDVSPLAVQGPMAENLLVDVFGAEIRDIKFFRFSAFPFMGRMLNIARSGWSKQGGFEIYLDDSNLGHALWDAIAAKGAPYNLQAGCPNLIERVESGLLSYGNDMHRDDTPLEVGLGKYCALDTDTDFIGKEALLRQRDTGITKKLMGLTIAGDPMSPISMPLACMGDNIKIGSVTSGVFSPTLGANIGFAMLDIAAAKTGNTISVDTLAGSQSATVCEISDFEARVKAM
jgi:dimethylsulfoniopropionate demethylase